MSTPYLFDNAVVDRHARLANGLPVEGEFEFADRLVWLACFPDAGVDGDDKLLDTFLDRKRALAPPELKKFSYANTTIKREDLEDHSDLRSEILREQSEAGGVGLGVLMIVALLAAAAWGWFHASSAPNGATLLGILILAAAVAMIATFSHFYRRAERRGAAYTAKVEKRLRQDTTGAHYGDA